MSSAFEVDDAVRLLVVESLSCGVDGKQLVGGFDFASYDDLELVEGSIEEQVQDVFMHVKATSLVFEDAADGVRPVEAQIDFLAHATC